MDEEVEWLWENRPGIWWKPTLIGDVKWVLENAEDIGYEALPEQDNGTECQIVVYNPSDRLLAASDCFGFYARLVDDGVSPRHLICGRFSTSDEVDCFLAPKAATDHYCESLKLIFGDADGEFVVVVAEAGSLAAGERVDTEIWKARARAAAGYQSDDDIDDEVSSSP